MDKKRISGFTLNPENKKEKVIIEFLENESFNIISTIKESLYNMALGRKVSIVDQQEEPNKLENNVKEVLEGVIDCSGMNFDD